MSDLKILDPKSILFVGGKPRDLPKNLRDQIRVSQWEQDDDRCSSPMPAPELVVIMLPWASHDKVDRGREYATTLNIPILDAAGTKSDMVKRAEEAGLDISGIFNLKKKKEYPKTICKRIEGGIKTFILKHATDLRFPYPLKTVDALQLQELVLTMMDTSLEVQSIQRAIRVAYRKNEFPVKRVTGEIPVEPAAVAPAASSSAPPLTPASVLPTAPIAKEEKFSITGSVEAIFKKLFEMHDRILSLIDERNMFAEEVAKLTADNKLLKEKNDKLAQVEAVIKNYQLK